VGGLLAGFISFITKSALKEKTQEKGILFASGLVAGDALIGIIIALLTSASLVSKITLRAEIPETTAEAVLGTAIFIILTIVVGVIIKAGKKQ
jgi:hypothetical protein